MSSKIQQFKVEEKKRNERIQPEQKPTPNRTKPNRIEAKQVIQGLIRVYDRLFLTSTFSLKVYFVFQLSLRTKFENELVPVPLDSVRGLWDDT